MKRWNPNLFIKEGAAAGYDNNYVGALVNCGREIDGLGLPVIYSLSHLARLSETRYSDLHAVISRIHSGGDFPYRNFTIKKRSGGRRWISVPAPQLMAAQSWIATRVLRLVPVHSAAYAYVANRSNPLFLHAERHVGATWILHMDIKDFFSNISERQVYHLFRSLKYPRLLSLEMARLCTRVTPNRKGRRWLSEISDSRGSIYKSRLIGSLPQGAPTSPAISNLVCREMDEIIDRVAQDVGATYGRYADDLCFSISSGSRQTLVGLKRQVDQVLKDFGFSANGKKQELFLPGGERS